MKIEITFDKKQNIVKIKQNEVKVTFRLVDFCKFQHIYKTETFSDKFSKEQWLVSSKYNIKRYDPIVTIERKGQKIQYKISQVPKGIL